MKVGVVGTGGISDIYLANMINMFDELEVVGCTARDQERIKVKAEKYGIEAMSMEEMLADDRIELIVNLTPVPAHYDIVRSSLLAGKHVYTEKTLASSYAEAKELIELAKVKGLRIGSAPDTFLGAGIQTATKAINDGMIGDITGFNIVLNRGLGLLYEFVHFLTMPSSGMGYDFGIYALTAVFSALGPALEVCGFSQTNRKTRTYVLDENPLKGQEYTIENENIMMAAIKMKNGALGTVGFNGDNIFPERPYIAIHGTQGSLYLPDPNQFGGDVIFVKGITHPSQLMSTANQEVVLPTIHKFAENSRGLAVAEMSAAIRENRPHRASAEMASHLLEVLDGIVQSSETKRFTILESRFEVPTPFMGNESF